MSGDLTLDAGEGGAKKKGKRRFWLKCLLVFFILALLLIYYCREVFSFFNSPPLEAEDAGEGSSILFEARAGMSVRDIALSLEAAGLIRSAEFAALYAKFFSLSLKAGAYILSPSMTTQEVLEALDRGDIAIFRVTVPEGLTLSRTAALFEEAGIAPEEFIAAARDENLLSEFGIPASSAEGYLFPDTYFIGYGESAESVARRMVSTFFERLASILPEDEQLTGRALHEKVILASIVEREYRVAEEAPLIAGVFANRLSINMGLQSCATIEYIITEINGEPHPERLTRDDLGIPSAYNTYLWAGLPPGPISNPSLTALSAAIFPSETSYFYFRLNDPQSGTHTFTTSLDAHIEAGREFYLKAEAGR